MFPKLLPWSAAFLALSLSAVNAAPLTAHGALSCAEWSGLQEKPRATEAIAVENWALGHLEGVAKFVDANGRLNGLPARDILQGLDRDAIIKLIGQYCKSSPTVEEAVHALTAQLIADRPVRVVDRSPQRAPR